VFNEDIRKKIRGFEGGDGERFAATPPIFGKRLDAHDILDCGSLRIQSALPNGE
jgi:hypothetical protein